MMVLSPWTQRRLQRAFMMRKVDRTGQLSEFNPLPRGRKNRGGKQGRAL